MASILGEATVQELREQARGEVVVPSDESYETVRSVWNAMVDRRPALILRCAGVADVMLGVQFARSQGLDLAVRGGGHSLPGFSSTDGGIVLDLSTMKGIRVDPDEKRAIVQPGATWGDLDHETQAFGLATTGGSRIHDRHCRPDPRWRDRVADAAARPRVRQPRVGRRRDRRRSTRPRERPREP
jgi:FAD/FMN-containing dehydrogenase